MNIEEYKVLALKTESTHFDMRDVAGTSRLLHAALGMCDEVGEIAKQIKAHYFYNKVLNNGNLIEELGDLLWYINLMCNRLQIPMDKVMELNIEKLKIRYPEKFSISRAEYRDIASEQEIFENL